MSSEIRYPFKYYNSLFLRLYLKLKPGKIMKTKILFIILFTSISICAFPQFKLGLRAAITSSTLQADNFTTVDKTTVETIKNAKYGFQGGLIARLSLVGIFIQPELLLSTTGGEVRLTDASKNVKTIKQTFTKLDIPVIVGTKLGPIRLGVGPVASVILNKPSESIDFSGQSIETKFNKATFGYQLNVGFDLGKKIALDLKYEGNLSRLGNGMKVGGTNYKFDSRNNQFILGLGLFF